MTEQFEKEKFQQSNYDDWRKVAEATLKGIPFEKKLITKTIENIELKPIYFDSDLPSDDFIMSLPAKFPYLRGYRNEAFWKINQIIDCTNPSEYNIRLKSAIENGQNAISLVFADTNHTSDFHGTKILSHLDLEIALDGIDVIKYPLFIEAGEYSIDAVSIIKDYSQSLNLPGRDLNLFLGFAPISIVAKHGATRDNFNKFESSILELVTLLEHYFPNGKALLVDSLPFHNAGADIVQELAISIAIGTQYMRELTKAGKSPEKSANQIYFKLGIASNFFFEMAKIRALRVLWAKVLSEFGLAKENCTTYILAQGSKVNHSFLDKNVNILRSTIESLAAIIGGADAITTRDFEELSSIKSALSERLARNTQLILQNESKLGNVIDPVGGSWYIENLTAELINKSWNLFREIEGNFGIINSLKSGIISNMINEKKQIRLENLNNRKEILLGVNTFVNMSESIELNDLIPSATKFRNDINYIIEPLEEFRAALPFENLQLNVINHSLSGNSLPKVLLANFGTASEYIARNDFASDFLHVGGFQTESSEPYIINEEGISSFLSDVANGNYSIIVFCSSDENYKRFVSELTKKLKLQSPELYIILAGYPKDEIQIYNDSGLDEFIHLKSNLVRVLSDLQKHFGIVIQ